MAHEKDTHAVDYDVNRASSPQPHGEIEDVKKPGLGQLDAAAEYLRIHQNEFSDITKEEERKVLRKIDFLLMPIMLVTITLAAVDKIVISNAALYGMKTDTGLVGQLYSWTGSIFYFGYLVRCVVCPIATTRDYF